MISLIIHFKQIEFYFTLKYCPTKFSLYKIKNSYSQDKQNFKEKVYYNKKKYIVPGYGLEIANDIVEKCDGYINIDKYGEEYFYQLC